MAGKITTSDIQGIAKARLGETKFHLKALGEFLSEWKWLVLTRPTHIVVEGILDSHFDVLEPLTSLTLESLSQVPFGIKVGLWPESLTRLVDISSTSELAHPVQNLTSANHQAYHRLQDRKASAKKRHETSRLTTFVASICVEYSVKCVIDIGSGLGYVDRELCQAIEDCRILAIESEEARCTSANEVNENQGLADRITQLPKKLHSTNVDEVSDIVRAIATGNCCLIALHACGDLTPIALQLFQENPLIKSAIILSCCYHKMLCTSGKGKTSFPNFPSSGYLKSLVGNGSVDPALIDVSCLRLAAESTRELWASRSPENHHQHARSVAFRAIVQSYEEKNNIKFTKTKRKAVNSCSRQSWDAYLSAWVANTEASSRVDGQPIERTVLLAELRNFYSEGEVDRIVRKTMAFNTLRNCVQQMVESFVLTDRLLALKESGFLESSLVRVSDPAISPRSLAIVVTR